jgi:hypothetical protein
VFRWVEHTGELELELDSASAEELFAEALVADRDHDASVTRYLSVPDPPLGTVLQNAKSCEPEGPQDLTGRLSHAVACGVKRERFRSCPALKGGGGCRRAR